MCGAQKAGRWLVLSLVVLLLLGSGERGWAQSLWNQSANPLDLFADHKAQKPGDLLTIIIVEKAQASQNASTKTDKSGEVNVGPGSGVLADLLPLIGAKASDETNATGTTVRGGSLSARITVVVKEVLPNGNLVVEGRQQILVNGEKQEIIVSGLVRPEDISRDNTVLSTYVADAKITYVGQGVLGEKQRPGILSRIFGWLF